MNGVSAICKRSLSRINPLSSLPLSRNLSNAKASASSASGFAKLSSRRLISVSGEDAGKYLQGLIAANVSRVSLDADTAFYSVFLNAQGRVLHDVFIYPAQAAGLEDGLLVEVDANEVSTLYKHLKRYKLRAKIGLRIVDEGEMSVWSSWAQPIAKQQNILKDERIPQQEAEESMGWRILSPADKKPDVDAEEVEQQAYDLRRMRLGVPEGQNEILKETALPQESNIDFMGGIDFRKGCYVGQELTIRTHHTGVVRKRILPAELYSSSDEAPKSISWDPESTLQQPPSGLNISRTDKKGRSAGKWLGGIGNIGLALCRLEIMTDTVLTNEGSQWAADHEFKIASKNDEEAPEKEVRIKAFVPWWHAAREQQQMVRSPVD